MFSENKSVKKLSLNNQPIGVFDSGVGGLTVLKHVIRLLPSESVIYFGDTANMPYGDKTPEQINKFAAGIIKFLLKQNVKAVVIACNSTSALAYNNLKKKYKLPILDVIAPAVKELPRITKNNKVGVIANSATVKSGVYEKQIKKMKSEILVYQQACPLLVPLIEKGEIETNNTYKVLGRYLRPLLNKKIDTLILGCTHYPHLNKLLKKILGGRVKILDPAVFLVEKLKNLLKKEKLASSRGLVLGYRGVAAKPYIKYFVSGNPLQFKKMGSNLLGRKIKVTKVAED